MSDVDTFRVTVGPEGWVERFLGGRGLSEHVLNVFEAYDQVLIARNQLLRHKSRSLNLSDIVRYQPIEVLAVDFVSRFRGLNGGRSALLAEKCGKSVHVRYFVCSI